MKCSAYGIARALEGVIGLTVPSFLLVAISKFCNTNGSIKNQERENS